jgi:dethiobiotin synthetase
VIRFITGTDSAVGKTVAAAALAWDELGVPRRVAYLKPVETGRRSGDWGDAEYVAAATGVRAGEGLRYEAAMPPALASDFSRVPVGVDTLVAMANAEHSGVDVLLVEGTGGFLTPLAGDLTMADLAIHLAAEVVVVTDALPRSLNAAALTVEAVRRRALDLAGVIVNVWPPQPDSLVRATLERFQRLAPVLGVIPFHAGLDTRDPRNTARAELVNARDVEFSQP